MRMGVIADVHGNEVALRAVLADAHAFAVEQWWVLGDLVLLGPRPAEVIELLRALPGVAVLRGNTDRYVVTGDQPHPHARAADAVGDVALVERYGLMAAGIGWTRGVLDQAGLFGLLTQLPATLRQDLPSGGRLLGVHACPGADDGQGIEPEATDAQLRPLFAGCGAEVVLGGHTHAPTDRVLDGLRLLNPGSVGLPRTKGTAGWLLLVDEGAGLTVTPRGVPFDVDAVIEDLNRRRHPNAEFVSAVLTGRRQQIRAACASRPAETEPTMPDSMLVEIATTLATKAAGTLFDLVKAKLTKRGSTAALDAAVQAGPDSAEITGLAEELDAAQHEDAEFGEQLRTEWQRIVDTQSGTGEVSNRISGTVTGNVVQARDIQGGISFGN